MEKECPYVSSGISGKTKICNWYCKNMVADNNKLFLYFPPCGDNEKYCPLKNPMMIMNILATRKNVKLKRGDKE